MLQDDGVPIQTNEMIIIATTFNRASLVMTYKSLSDPWLAFAAFIWLQPIGYIQVNSIKNYTHQSIMDH